MLEVIEVYIVISKPGSGRVHRVPFSGSGAMVPCDPSSAFFGFMGVTSALVFANLGAASRLTIAPV